MFSFPSFYHFDFLYVLLTVFLSTISCILGINMSKKSKPQKNKGRVLVIHSLVLGFTFWLTNVLVSNSAGIPFSTNYYLFYFFFNFLFCFIGSFIALSLAHMKIVNARQYITGILIIGLSIVSAVGVGFSILFQGHLEVKPLLLILTTLLTFGTAVSILRFLIQMTNDEIVEIEAKWKYIGSFIAGTALAGIPYIVLVSIIDFENAGSLPSIANEHLFLVPFIFVSNANLVLMLVPDLYGGKIFSKNIQSYESLFHYNPGAVFSVNKDGVINNVNPEAIKLTGYSADELIGESIQLLVEQAAKELINLNLSNAIQGMETHIETKMKKKNGDLADVKIKTVRTIIDNKIIGVFGIVEDITERKKTEERIQYLAYHDELTGLPNRRLMKAAMTDFTLNKSPFSVILLDFDRFKKINDTFGHPFGDSLLIEAGKKLNSIAGGASRVSRMGGDEFLAVIPELDYERFAEQVMDEFRTPFLVNGIEFSLTASMGVASYPKDTDDIDELIKFADIAMYQTKENGANGYSVYRKDMSDGLMQRFSLEHNLRKALDNKQEFEVYLQPKFHSNFKGLAGAEALLRWNHPDQGVIAPDVFIPLAEESGLIVPLERCVILNVCEILYDWKTSGKAIERISINISIISLLQEDFVEFITETLNKYGLDGRFIEFEITERMVMKNEDYVNYTLQELRHLGIKISIDDFGTGYSSLSYLYKLHVDILKIDPMFIRQIEENKEVVSAIISMARNLQLKVVAEGVETKEQLELLNELGCDEVQGFYFSPPVPSEQFEQIFFGEAS